MLNIVYGALGAILVLLLFAAGVYAGYKLNARHAAAEEARAPKPEPLTPAEAERLRLIADQNAFRCVMNYSSDVAYGEVSAKDFMGREVEER